MLVVSCTPKCCCNPITCLWCAQGWKRAMSPLSYRRKADYQKTSPGIVPLAGGSKTCFNETSQVATMDHCHIHKQHKQFVLQISQFLALFLFAHYYVLGDPRWLQKFMNIHTYILRECVCMYASMYASKHSCMCRYCIYIRVHTCGPAMGPN